MKVYLEEKETNRLIIRKLNKSDWVYWKEFFHNNESLKFFSFDLSLGAEQNAKNWIESQLSRYKKNEYGLMALIEKNTNKLIGQCGLLTQVINDQQEIEIGYHVLPQFWGNGYATEGAKFFKSFAFENKLSDSPISIIHEDNIRSQKVAEKNGMKRTLRSIFKGLPVFIYRYPGISLEH